MSDPYDKAFVWKHYAEDFCRPTRCPICNAPVFFVRHNSGSVWFDALGKPWPKHACFDGPDFWRYDNPYYAAYGSNRTWWTEIPTAELNDSVLGIIVKAERRRRAEKHRLMLRCSDQTLCAACVPLTTNIEELVGEMVLLSLADQKMICINLALTIPFVEGPGDYVVGQFYRHPTFGIGRLLATEGQGEDYKVTILFPEAGEKRLKASIACLTCVAVTSA